MRELIEETLERLIPKTDALPYSGARYSIFSGGKRIRPLLTLLTLEMLGKPPALGLEAGAALEMIHTYSLIHDDLPCMDDDDFRRGKPTLHRVIGEGQAVLVGDYLLTYAFEVLANAPLTPQSRVELIKELAVAAGGEGMVGGQALDIAHSTAIEELHAKKTGALFLCAVRMGCIIAGIHATALDPFGRAFGLYFQAVDDVADGDSPLGQEGGLKRVAELEVALLATLPADSPFHPLIEGLRATLASTP